jgi:hypothetical protein
MRRKNACGQLQEAENQVSIISPAASHFKHQTPNTKAKSFSASCSQVFEV